MVRARALLTGVLCCVIIRYETSKKLVSHDIRSNIFNYKTSFSVEIAPICKVSFSTNHPGDLVHKCAAFAARVSDFSKNSHRVKNNRVVLTLIHCLPVHDRPDTCHTQDVKLPLPTLYCITCRHYLKSHPTHLVNSAKDFVAYYYAVCASQRNPSTCFWVKDS